MPFFPRAWRRIMGGAALALLIAALAPAKVQAECGDYVMAGGKHAATTPAGPASSDPSTPAIPCPCKGPGCSKGPTQPLIPPVPPPSVSSGEWACLAADLMCLPDPNSGLDGEQAPFRQI